MQLREMQELFAQSAFGQASEQALENAVVANGIEPARRLQVYRNNVRSTLIDVLQATYPQITKLVGEEFFETAARRYIARFPSRTGNVADYGGDMAEFLAEMPEASHLRYLPDIARIEWGCQVAYHAMDADSVTVDALSEIAPDDHPEVVFTLHPSICLVQSRHPVFDIWQFVLADGESQDAPPDLDAPGQNVMVLRQNGEVNVLLLSESEFAFAAHVHQGATLGDAVEHLSERGIEFSLQDILHKFFSLGTMVAATTASAT